MDDISRLATDVLPEDKVDVEVPEEEHEQWKESWGKSFQIQDFFTHEELEWLTDLMYRHHTRRRVKESGTLHFFSDNSKIEKYLFDKLKEVIPSLEATGQWEGNFLQTASPYNIHTDTGRPDWLTQKNLIPGKQIIIPLFVGHMNKEYKGTGKIPPAGTAIFNDRVIKYGTNFAKGNNNYNTDVFYTVRDYNEITCYNVDGTIKEKDWDKPMDDEMYKKYFSHMKRIWTDGWELEGVYQWDRRSLIVFDRCQVHSGIDFPKYDVTMKAGLSLMTTRWKQ